MFSSRSFRYFGLLVLSASTASAASSLTFTSTGCVDPSGFDTCIATTNSQVANIFNQRCSSGQCTNPDNCYSPDPDCAEAIICQSYSSWINCALSHCWNRAYGCEYQNLVNNALANCPIASNPPPYYPAPHGGAGSCSCNIGFVYYEHRLMNNPGSGEVYHCQNNVPSAQAETCNCCAASSATSTFFNSCPSTDPSQVPFFNVLGYNTLISSQCSSTLNGVTCSNLPYNFTLPPGPSYDPSIQNQFFTAATLPKNGTDPLSDTPGALTSAASGGVLTWSIFSGGALTASASVSKFNTGSSPATTSAASPAGSTSAAASGGSGSSSGGNTPATSVAGGSGGSSASTTASAAAPTKSLDWKLAVDFKVMFLVAVSMVATMM